MYIKVFKIDEQCGVVKYTKQEVTLVYLFMPLSVTRTMSLLLGN